MNRFILALLLTMPSCFAFASSTEIEDYAPPPMFDEPLPVLDTLFFEVDESNEMPPLPPRRPKKFAVSKSYIQKLMQQKIIHSETSTPITNMHGELEDKILDQDVHDVLQAINPQ